MKLRYFAVLPVMFLMGCETDVQVNRVSTSDPRVQTLLEWPVPEYYANLRVARRIADQCPRYSFDRRLDSNIAEQRSGTGRGPLAAAGQRGAIDLEFGVKRRSFEAIHQVDLDSSNLCAAGDDERARNTPLSVLLVPTG
ncbi:hypothetical protein [Pseudaestuariivita rosea]|uniref:hypothetical protein n=1 Tax=Pseudaestuariivita rosea TaxID=2763263 RepID=UPI001ABB9F84|nr:hypothetical protein [Pseudaestuariivita rosea]